MSIDLTPIDGEPTRDEVRRFRAESRASGRFPGVDVGAIVVLVVVGVWMLVLIGGFAAAVVAVAQGSGSPIAIAFVLFALLAAALVVYAVLRGAVGPRGRWARWLRLTRLAEANGWVFSAHSRGPSYPGAIFGLGDSRRVVEHLRSARGRYFDVGSYRYVTGSGKSRTTHDWGFLALKLDRRLPHIVLDSRANNGLFGGTNLPYVFARDQILSLEGDFDRYFTLYCPAEYERDALYVFTPDLMALLIDEASPYDVELVDDWMFVYSAMPFDLCHRPTLERLLRIRDVVGAKTLSQTARYADDRVGDRSADVVAPQGRRLRPGVSVGAIVVAVLVLLGWGWGVLTDVVESLAGG